MDDLISRQSAIDEIEHELEMINLALDSTTLDYNTRERLRQRKGEAREILNSIQQIPSAQPEIIRCRDCVNHVDRNFCRKANHYTGDCEYCASVFGAERGTNETD